MDGLVYRTQERENIFFTQALAEDCGDPCNGIFRGPLEM